MHENLHWRTQHLLIAFFGPPKEKMFVKRYFNFIYISKLNFCVYNDNTVLQLKYILGVLYRISWKLVVIFLVNHLTAL